MKIRSAIRPKSLTSLNHNIDLNQHPLSKNPQRPINPCLILKNSQLLINKKRIKMNSNTVIKKPACALTEGLPEKSFSCDTFKQTDYTSDSDSIDTRNKFYETLYSKLQNRLVNLRTSDSIKNPSIYLDILKELIGSDYSLGKIIESINDYFYVDLKKKYEEKIAKLKNKLSEQKNLVSTLKLEKDSFISKLNSLSSINIDLLRDLERLENKQKKIEETFSGPLKKSTNLTEEILQKNEKIKILTFKIEEMACHENKLLQIIDKFNVEGVDVKKLYSHTPVKQNLFKDLVKKNKRVPDINLSMLNSTESSLFKDSFNL